MESKLNEAGQDQTNSNDAQNDNENTPNAPNGDESDYEDKPRRTNSKRKKVKATQPMGKGKSQKTLGELINPKQVGVVQPEVINLCTSEPGFNDERRKRRRTSQTDSVDVGAEPLPTPPQPGAGSGRNSPQVVITASSPLPKVTDLPDNGVPVPKTPPRKLLRLNANGKFSSPPSKSIKAQEEIQAEPPKRRTRQRKSARVDEKGTLVVVICYGQDDPTRTSLGAKIDRILDGEEGSTAKTSKSTPKKRTPRKTKAKSTHPFFIVKDDPPAAPKSESPRKASAVTPGKLRRQVNSDRVGQPKEAQPFESALLKDKLVVKQPGAKDAPFPPRDWCHVRGSDDDLARRSIDKLDSDKLYHKRKRKQARLPFPMEQSLLYRFASQLHPEPERQLRFDGFYEPSEDLVVPRRLLISGDEIAAAVAKQLSVSPANLDQDELSLTSSQQAVHPAVKVLFDRIPSTMTAFDELRGETMSWAQKYAPGSAAEILQSANEVSILKDWLKSLAVQAVGGAAAVPKQPASRPADKPRKKRKKKPDDLDDFLVDSDDEVNEMSEIVDDDTVSVGSQRAVKSIVQATNDRTKLSNAVLLSGPHGCGKSAAAHAVAKEMGYKIFEISSSERRSGRDVLDKVGDMTENHLVRHHGVESAEASLSEDPDRIDEAFQKDLQTGRQGKMSAFFKPQAKPKLKFEEHKNVVKEKTLKVVQQALRKQPKDQQQSLILLEEVDVLFKDDKEFWTTVLRLITTSKRPFIMTCNDEYLLPLDLSLHAILRFARPAPALASDYMLVMAAAEGHLLPRSAVNALYERLNHDLRASITELNFWCQMGVGDPREGLGWMYQRWPPGSDLDEQGRHLRVVSDGTYQEGMSTASKSASTPEDTLSMVWDEFGIEPVDALGLTPMPDESTLTTDVSLKSMSRLADALSAADSCCTIGLPATAPLDTAQPELSDRARSNYMQGLQLLQTDERVDYSGMSSQIVVTTTLLASQLHKPTCYMPSKHEIIANAARLNTYPRANRLNRRDFACFDPISAPAETTLSSQGLLVSAFDGPLNTLALDLAPYVRSIVQHDQALEEQRGRLDLLTSDGRTAKRARTTRAARSALEGGQRATTRRERWFTKDLDFDAVLATGGKGWARFSGPLEFVDEQSRVSTEAAASTAEEDIKYE